MKKAGRTVGLSAICEITSLRALSDGPQSLTFEQFDQLMADLRPYAELAERAFC